MTASTKPIRPELSLEVEPTGVVIDQVFDERLRLRDRGLPGGRRIARQLVRILAVRQPDDADVLQLHARGISLELSDQSGECRHAERAGLLAGRIHVIRQRDPAGIAGQQGDMARG